MTDTDYQEHLEGIDHQILKLLKERLRVATEAREAGEREEEMDTIDLWVGEGEEMDMDPDAMEKVVRAILALCKKRNEE